ncbi:glycosyltransferase family 2 protein [Pelagibius marinus]|uniref:glycosyltransferase family 2 protein n=1 Tax=Pelagibius marinus TaxID=2762760 RepID=UPI001872D46A|nr:glycosyltransferase family 2 protein [Pelagibius marinus]
MDSTLSIALLGLCGLCALAMVYPYVLYPLILARLPERPLRPVAGQAAVPRLSLAFCAYNEAAVLPVKIENLRALRAVEPELEILAYSDGSSDATAALLQAEADWIRVFAAEARHGKSHGMNTLVQAASGDIIVFTDANVMVDPASLAALRRDFADPLVGCVCGNLIYTNLDEGATAATGSLYWRLEERIKALESRSGSTMGADGALFAVRRALYPPVPPDIIDDMFVSLSILCDGHRVLRDPAVLAYERAATDSADEFKRKIRIACQAFNCHRLLSPRLRRLSRLDRFKYISHKLLRWFGIYFFALGALAAAAWLVMQGLALLALAGLAAGALLYGAGRAGVPMLLAKAVEILRAMAATGIGLFKSRRGERFQTWDLPASSRKPG